MSWHVDEKLVRSYADAALDEARAASIEAHLMGCEECRALVSAGADGDRLERGWVELRDAVDRPRRRPIEALLIRLGMRNHIARLVAATPSLQVSWFTAVTIAIGWAAFAARQTARGVVLFLVVAPLIPLAGVAFAFGPGVDPTYEVGVSAPMRGLRLLMIRAGTVLVATIALDAVATLALPQIGWKAVAWLLPALGVTLATVALSTWIDPLWAAGIVGFTWAGVVSVSPAFTRGKPLLDRIVVFDAPGQAASLIVMVVAVFVIIARMHRFDTGREG